MDGLRRQYRRLDDWVSGLSRGPYALLTGVLTGLLVLATTTVVEGPDVGQAAAMTVGMTVAFYWADPNSE